VGVARIGTRGLANVSSKIHPSPLAICRTTSLTSPAVARCENSNALYPRRLMPGDALDSDPIIDGFERCGGCDVTVVRERNAPARYRYRRLCIVVSMTRIAHSVCESGAVPLCVGQAASRKSIGSERSPLKSRRFSTFYCIATVGALNRHGKCLNDCIESSPTSYDRVQL
jgi:hypothetical protein